MDYTREFDSLNPRRHINMSPDKGKRTTETLLKRKAFIQEKEQGTTQIFMKPERAGRRLPSLTSRW